MTTEKFIFKILVPNKNFTDYREIYYTIYSNNIDSAFASVSNVVSKLGFVDYLICEVYGDD